jgi:deoxycytidylate deaminase
MSEYLYIEEARLQAEKSHIEMATQYGCVLVYNGKIVSKGNNKRKGGFRFSKLKECPLCG